jgi:hypothetical protein
MPQEQCVVATLATLLHIRGIWLMDRTVLYLHGEDLICGDHSLCAPRYSRVILRDAVDRDGWDKVADFLARVKRRLFCGEPGDATQWGKVETDEFDILPQLPGLQIFPETVTRTQAASIANVYRGTITQWCKNIPGLAVGTGVSFAKLIEVLANRPPREKTGRRRNDSSSADDSRHDTGDLHEVVSLYILGRKQATRDEIINHVRDACPGTPDLAVDRVLGNSDCFRMLSTSPVRYTICS